MHKLWIVCAFVISLGCQSNLTSSNRASSAKIKLGIDVLRESNFAQVAGKRVGLIANPASVDSHLRSTVDLFKQQDRCKLVALFGPEHGIYADEYAGDQVSDRTDESTGLPIYSLYGKTRKPTTRMVKGLDAFVLDLQDIGCRSYTYVGTMKTVMQRCAEDDIELIILDRPNPLGGERFEGPELTPKFTSFISSVPTPYVHGMTMGELALMVRDKFHPKFSKLTIVKMQGWTREMTWADTRLPWVPTSPQIPQSRGAAMYVATGIIGELLVLSNGIGYTLPFETVGAPWINGEALADALNEHWDAPAEHYRLVSTTQPSNVAVSHPPADLKFRPIRYKPFFQKFAGEPVQGVHIHLEPDTRANLVEINFKILQALDAPSIFNRADPKRFTSFDKVGGSDEPRSVLVNRGDLDGLFQKWRMQCERFRADRKKHLLY